MPGITQHSLAVSRARLARAQRAARRSGDPVDQNQANRAKSDYVALKLEAHIRDVVASAPPLTPEQRDELALLLKGGATDAA